MRIGIDTFTAGPSTFHIMPRFPPHPRCAEHVDFTRARVRKQASKQHHSLLLYRREVMIVVVRVVHVVIVTAQPRHGCRLDRPAAPLRRALLFHRDGVEGQKEGQACMRRQRASTALAGGWMDG